MKMYVIVVPVSDVSVCEMKMGFVKEMEKKFKKDIRNCLLTKQWCRKPLLFKGCTFGVEHYHSSNTYLLINANIFHDRENVKIAIFSYFL